MASKLCSTNGQVVSKVLSPGYVLGVERMCLSMFPVSGWVLHTVWFVAAEDGNLRF